MTLTPAHGARFELTLDRGGDAARYLIEARTAEQSFAATADLDRAGVRIEWATPPPKWIADTTLGLVRTLHRNHQGDRQWPSRLHRWREER